MPRFLIQKLIRDQVGILPEMRGVKVLAPSDYQLELKRKLVEEATETMSAPCLETLQEEIADTQEVLDALIEAYGFSQEKITHLQAQKRLKKGGFDQRLYVEYAEISEASPAFSLFKNYSLKKREKKESVK